MTKLLLVLLSLFICCTSYAHEEYNDENTPLEITDEDALSEEEEIIDNEGELEEPENALITFEELNDKNRLQPVTRKVGAASRKKFLNDKKLHYVKNKKEKADDLYPAIRWNLLERIIDMLLSVFNSAVLKLLLWTLVALLTVYIVYWLAGLDYNILLRKNKKDTSSNNLHTHTHLLNTDLNGSLEEAIRQNDLRQAVRYMFLIALKTLMDSKAIVYREDKTNNEYAVELHGTPHYPHFVQLARAFDYVWYGKFHISPDDFARLKPHLQHFTDNAA
ncbi:MAG: DUF4129 domain-containing protein [Chitinophagales bacterium]|nr:DUF4129 domain-containing protein [Chitinophagales bacterium]MDW8417779.1 DUF4129 domain-containing protein [Chitinophagales bacterium]